LIGQEIIHFKIIEKLGEGGMGVVYKAEDSKLKREVAIKFLPRRIDVSDEERERFKIEGQAAAALNHPNIATIYAIEEVDDEMFIVMEYIKGRELRQLLIDEGELTIDEVLDYATQIAAGLQAAHEKGITHRDIKSSNIMITEKSMVKIMDFGLAKTANNLQLTKEGVTLGTIAYMSPEQSRGIGVDHRTDIWAFGIVMYEMLTGEPPFKGDYEQAILYSIMHEEPDAINEINPDVPDELTHLVTKALRKKSADRYQSMGDLLAELNKCTTDTRTQIAKPVSPETRRLSMAVLPFVDLSPQKDQEYFCDGITEELIDALAKIEGWRVVSRTSVFTFKGKNENIRTIGERLNVSHALEGSVRKAGNRLRITAQLINVDDGFQLWSEKYDRELEDVFAIQDDIANMIVDKLKTEVGDDRDKVIIKRYTDNIEAYNYYLQARFHWNQRTEQGSRKGISYCEQAIAIDPEYALAYAGLADCTMMLGFQGFMQPNEAMPKAQEWAEKALAFDGDLGEAHVSLGCIHAVYYRNWDLSKKEFELALRLNPNSATAHYWYALWFLLPNGQFDACLNEIQKALELDPLSLVLNTGIGWQHYFAREFDQAISALQKTLELDGDYIIAHDILGQVFEQKGMLEEATKEIEKAVALSSRRTLSLGTLGHVYSTAGKSQKANKVLTELTKRATKKYVSAYDVALVFAGLGDSDQTFEFLERAYDEHNGWLNFLNVEPRFDDLRSDRRFADLVKKVGLQRESK